MYTNVSQLKELISDSIAPLIGRECILVDAPYYENVGDVLIWEGTLQFLKEHNVKLKYCCSYRTCKFLNLNTDVTILFQGGGNVGDLYLEHSDFLLKIVAAYPNNRIIILPQTLYYKDKVIENDHLTKLARHSNLYFCARDKVVYDNVSKWLREKTLLVPDLAFYVSFAKLDSLKVPTEKGKLLLRRNDIEISTVFAKKQEEGSDVKDWPTMEKPNVSVKLNRMFFFLNRSNKRMIKIINSILWNAYARYVFKDRVIKNGVRFISAYELIETTRLHGCILSLLLGKEVKIFDNAYGKNLNFYDTWLSDFPNVTKV